MCDLHDRFQEGGRPDVARQQVRVAIQEAVRLQALYQVINHEKAIEGVKMCRWGCCQRPRGMSTVTHRDERQQLLPLQHIALADTVARVVR